MGSGFHTDELSVLNVQEAFERGEYPQVITQLRHLPTRTPRQEALLGMALFRTGNFPSSELPLATAIALGDQEALVEYGNLLRVTNDLKRATQHFEKILPTLSGELRYRALRWYGVTLCEGNQADGIERIEEARLGYLGLGDIRLAARLSHTIAVMLMNRGEFRQAGTLLEHALPALIGDTNPRPRFNALLTMYDVQAELGQLEEATAILEEARTLAMTFQDAYIELQLMARQLLLYLRYGDYGKFSAGLEHLRSKSLAVGDVYLFTFASNNLANHLSRTGQHAQALRVLAELSERCPAKSLETNLVSAMLTLRRGDASGALGQLKKVRDEALAQGMKRDATRASLIAALAAYQMNDFDCSMTHLSEGLTELAGWSPDSVQVILRQEIMELEEVLVYARQHRALQPLLEASLSHTAAAIAGVKDDLLFTPQFLELKVLGRNTSAKLDGLPLHFRLTYSVPILTYLALQPDRTRQEITADLWADQDAVRAGANFRQCLSEIRRMCGPDIIVIQGPYHEPRYSLTKKVNVFLDSQRFQQLLDAPDSHLARDVYSGQFLEGLPESDWISEWRSALSIALSVKLTEEIHSALALGADRQVVTLCSALLEVDPENQEIEDLRLEKARKVCSAWEVAKFEARRLHRLN